MDNYAQKLLDQETITFEEFQKFAISTRQYDDKFHGLAVCFMKLPGELNEFLKEKSADKKMLEAGDVLWKIANICDYMKIDFNCIDGYSVTDDPCIYEYLERAGKMIRDKDINHFDRRSLVIYYITYCFNRIIYDSPIVPNGFKLTHLYRLNITKLSKRKEKGTILNR